MVRKFLSTLTVCLVALASLGYMAVSAEYTGTPYGGTAPQVKGDGTVTTIQMEHFDVGGKGIAYDTESTTKVTSGAHAFRPETEIPFWDRGIYYGGYWSWTNYTVNVSESGKYLLKASLISDGSTLNKFYVKANDADLLPNSQSWSTNNVYAISTLGTIELNAGVNVITFGTKAKTGYLLIDRLMLERATPSPYKDLNISGTASSRIWASYYDNGGLFNAETNPDGAYYTNATGSNSVRSEDKTAWHGTDIWKMVFWQNWFTKYTAKVEKPGFYDVSLNYSTGNANAYASLKLYVDDVCVLDTVQSAITLCSVEQKDISLGTIEITDPKATIKVESTAGSALIWRYLDFSEAVSIFTVSGSEV